MGNYHARFHDGLGVATRPSLLCSGNYSQFSFDGVGRNAAILEYVRGTLSETKHHLWSFYQRCEERDAAGAISKKISQTYVEAS